MSAVIGILVILALLAIDIVLARFFWEHPIALLFVAEVIVIVCLAINRYYSADDPRARARKVRR